MTTPFRWLSPVLLACMSVFAIDARAATADPLPVTPIARVLIDRDRDTVPDAKGRKVRVQGVVVAAPQALRSRGFQVMVQDATGGIGAFDRNDGMPLAPGDRIDITGRVHQFKGAVQLQNVQVRRLGRGTLPEPAVIPVAQADGWRHMGRRVRVEGILGDVAMDTFGSVRLTGDDGASVSLYIPAPVVGSFDWKRYPRGTRVAATGVVSIFKPTWPYDGGFQVIVSRADDLKVLAAPTPAWHAWIGWVALAVAGVLAIALLAFHVLNTRHKARQRELAALAALSSAVATPDLPDDQLARNAVEILTAYGIVEAALVQGFDERGHLHQLAAAAVDPSVANALHSREALPSNRIAGDAHRLQLESRIAPHGLSLLGVHPLAASGGTLGFLVALSTRPRAASGVQERTLLAAVKLLAMALDNARTQRRAQDERHALQQLVITDPLTRLYNRRFLDEYLRVQVPLAERRGGGLAFIALDIDHFKHVNDTWGHEAGDRVLDVLAATLREVSRSSDLPVRVGGEEFVVIAAEDGAEQAWTFAERLRAVIESVRLDDVVPGQSLRMTVSVGVAVFGLHGTTAAQLLRASDDAMYASKRNGRNRTTLADRAADAVTHHADAELADIP